ncbi:hypothetical protein BD769DRAFT_1392410 [Suillus cothurnatus]|nr:hypothetical protein BD769DRAFT_1392410 [Suillus cothurnatus]
MTKSKNDARTDPTETCPSMKMRLANTGDGREDQVISENTSNEPEQIDNERAVEISTQPKQDGGQQAAKQLSQPILIEDDKVEDYDEVLKIHLHKLSEYTNPKASVYALGKLLPTTTWGQYKVIRDCSKVLCNPATGEPITIWVVGKIAKMWFTKFGIPENQASITIMPLSKTLAQQSAILLAKLSSPALTPQSTQIVRAMKWQNGKNSSVDTKAILFDAVYDARPEGSLKTYDERPLWSLSDLKPGDLILLEMKMTCYMKKVDDKWESHGQYEMMAISLLNIAPMPEPDEGSHVYIQSGEKMNKALKIGQYNTKNGTNSTCANARDLFAALGTSWHVSLDCIKSAEIVWLR